MKTILLPGQDAEETFCPQCQTPFDFYYGYRMLCAQCNPNEQHLSAHKAAIDAFRSRHPQSVSEK